LAAPLPPNRLFMPLTLIALPAETSRRSTEAPG